MPATKRKQGGAGPYRKGAALERLVKRAYEADGWFVVRSPQSGSPIDLTCVPPLDLLAGGHRHHERVHFVQVKSRGYLRPAERTEVITLAGAYGGLPVLAWLESSSAPINRRDLLKGEELDQFPNPGPVTHTDHS